MSEFLVISCSLNPQSKSRILCREAYDQISKKHTAELIDLREIELPMCDGAAAYGHPNVAPLAKKVAEAKCILLGIPVYNYTASASAKNLIELTGKAWTEKVAGFLCAAGGTHSYMSVMNMANSLMLDFRCIIIPRFVYSPGDPADAEVKRRIAELADTASRLTQALHQ